MQLVFNVSGGQRVTLRREERETRSIIRAGSLDIVLPDSATRAAVTGRADTVQIIVSKVLIESVAGHEAHLQAVAAQALVVLARDSRESRARHQRAIVDAGRLLAKAIHRVAAAQVV